MNRQRKVTLRSLILCIICSFYTSCGTLGGIGDIIYFPTSKKKLEVALDSLFAKHSEYKIPKKWKGLNDWSASGYDFLQSRIFYFKSPPEEMYYVTFVGDSTMLADTTKVGIGIRSVFRESTYKWSEDDSLNTKEKERIIKRFDKEIIPKLEEYTKTKAYKESPYK